MTHAFHVLKGWNDVYYLSSKDSRPAPMEHHEQRQGSLPRQVQVGGQGLIFRCGKEEDPAMLSDYTMPVHIFKGSILRMTLHYAWHNQPLYLQDHSCPSPTKALQRLTQVANLFLKQPSAIQPENVRPVLKLVQRLFVAKVLKRLTIRSIKSSARETPKCSMNSLSIRHRCARLHKANPGVGLKRTPRHATYTSSIVFTHLVVW